MSRGLLAGLALLAALPLRAEDAAHFPALPAPPEIEIQASRDLRPPEDGVRAAQPSGGDATLLRQAEAAPARVSVLPDLLPDLPEPPAIALSDELRAAEKPGLSAQATADIALPEPPPVIVSLEPAAPPVTASAAAGAGLDLDPQRLEALLEPARAKFRLTQAEIESFVAFYQARDFQPLWLDLSGPDAVVSRAAEMLAETLAGAEADGLDPARLLAALPARRSGALPARERAPAEIAFSVAAFLYAHDARGGRLTPARLSSLLTPKLEIPAPAEVLAPLAGLAAAAVPDALRAHQPPHAGYRALRAELARVRREIDAPLLTGAVAGAEGAPQPPARLPEGWLAGPPLLPGKADPRVAMLRLRLGLPAAEGDVYDEPLRQAVIAFQRANELTPNGRITPKTRAALEDPRAPRDPSETRPDLNRLVATIIANMERWRWLPRDLGRTHVFVNVPDFRMRFIDGGKVAFETRVIVGKPETQTPIFSDEMDHLIVNPSWHVPPSILRKEFLPKLATDPDYAARRGFEVVRRGNAISIRQPPGERNALGHVKFMFPNQHSVYLHDTPTRNLFSAETRAFSHGCVRVQNPFAFAEKLIGHQGHSEQSLRAMVGRGERMIRLQEKIPVHLTYFTVFVDEAGVMQQRRDLYGHDQRVRAALAL
ncbi:L,D-transpeptidase family protein [Rhabdaerophilum calidifontis]|uniref:L,D-transpeptidase family protein n=1 Tax=Rhabdaerophilum calidifontis TaxID=2604328 RepID=UPI00123A0215|nr:L,D-transpeptidase family protein [Rhabdaerophilum calidifontis]